MSTNIVILRSVYIWYLPSDQTPTPTKFLRNCEELGLFQELAQKNPFDDSFKKALDDPRVARDSSV